MKNTKKLTYPSEGGTYYDCNYTINKKKIKRLIISNHYKKKHSKYMNDKLIIKFIEDYLDGKRFEDGKKQGVWEYFVRDPLFYQEKSYRLIWLFHKDIPDFLGIVNCHYSQKKNESHEKK